MCLYYKSYGGKWTTGSFPWVILGFKVLGNIALNHATNYLFPTRGDPYVSNNVTLIPDLIKCAVACVAMAAPNPWPLMLNII